ARAHFRRPQPLRLAVGKARRESLRRDPVQCGASIVHPIRAGGGRCRNANEGESPDSERIHRVMGLAYSTAPGAGQRPVGGISRLRRITYASAAPIPSTRLSEVNGFCTKAFGVSSG